MATPDTTPMPGTARLDWFMPIGLWYAKSRLRRAMDGVFVSGLEGVQRLSQEQGVLLAANHVAWWDPFLLIVLDEGLQTTGYAIMDAENLQRYPFFGWVGAIPIDRSSASSSRRGLKDAAALLGAPRQAVWIFPQGRQRPHWLRPLDLKPGIRLLARLAGVPVVPVSFTYGFREDERPSAVVRFGAPLEPRRKDLLAALEEAIIEGLTHNDAFLEGKADYDALIAPQQRQQQDGLGARILTLFGRSSNG